DGLTVGQLLASQRLPETLFQPYLVRGDDATPVPLSTRLNDLPPDADKLVLCAIRNTLFSTILPADPVNTGLPHSVEPGVGFRQIRPGPDGQAVEMTAVLDYYQSRELVKQRVAEFVQTHNVAKRGCLFGVSGGGDSNALAYGLAAAVPPEQLCAFTVVFGAAFTEAAASRAAVLCQDLGIRHTILRNTEIVEILGMRTSVDDLYEDFIQAFGDKALHFFGTFLILRIARHLADRQNMSDLAFGYNREDLLAEALFMLMNGRQPLALPTRPMGKHRVIMPVWEVPKLVLDACHPAFSLENYRERDSHTLRTRSLAFFLAHAMDSAYPSFGLSVLTGIAQVFQDHWGELTYDDDLDVFVTSHADESTIDTVRSMLSKHFN
ncbi:MAG: hypothetical protein K2Q25_05495, partial [Mycobacteriaceae bacterium]|nr:hypothetical protein [Mycobacteriaceae bacterium]